MYATVNDTGIYEVTCDHGHESTIVVAATRHEQLFELGLSAISDQYFREAVSSFAAALERFYEFSISVLAQSAGIDFRELESAWKHLSRQSERQLGGFVTAYLMIEKKSPVVLNQKSTELRNEVIHKGKFPTLDEAFKFGDEVLYVIRSTLSTLRSRHPEAFESQLMKPHLETLQSPNLQGKFVTHHYPAMTLRNLELEDFEGRDTRHYVWLLGVRHGRTR